MEQRLLVIKKGGDFPSKIMQRFEEEGFQVRCCMEKSLIVPHLLNSKSGIIILENWGLHELEEIISYCMKQIPHVGLVVVSTEKYVPYKVKVLDLGANDYIEIPYHMDELVARVKTHLRRERLLLKAKSHEEQKGGIFPFSIKKNEVYKNDQMLSLSLREFQLLTFLIKKEGQVFSRRELLNKVWGYGEREELFCDIRTVDVTVRRVREKIEDYPKKPKYLLTKRGLGYFFQKRDESHGWPKASTMEITLKK